MSVVVGKLVRCRKAFLRDKCIDLDSIKTDLTIHGTRNAVGSSRQPLVTYYERGGYIYLPKAYGMLLAKRERLTFSRIDNAGDPINVTFRGKLRANQVRVVQDTICTLRQSEGAIMNMYCGFGKTTCCNFITCDLQLKTLILVHSSSLVEQWKQRIQTFVKGSNVGLIRQKTFDIEGKTHVIGLMQSICKRDYGRAAFNSFGLTVIDECHHVCAESLSKCLQKAGSRYRLGLSATPFRKDGFTPFLFQAVGAIACTVARDKSTQDMDVHAVQLSIGPTQVHYVRRAGKQSVNIARMINDITEFDQRTDVVVRFIRKHAKGDRHVMVLSDRREHLRQMHARLMRGAGSQYTAAFMVGGASAAQMHLAEKATVIFATYAYASEGVDVPSLDTLVFASPRVDIVQTSGRILRKHKNKKKPLVVDFIDKFSLFQRQFSKRLVYYKKLGANVTHMDQLQRVCPELRGAEPHNGDKPQKKRKFAFVFPS